MSWRHVSATAAPATRIDVGDLARTREFSRHDNLREHGQRHHQLGKSGGAKHLSSSSERSGWLLTQQDADLAVGVSVDQDQKTLGKKENDHLTSSQTVNEMMGKLITSKHPELKCSNMLQTGAPKERRRSCWNPFQKQRVRQSSHSHDLDDFGVQSTLSFFRNEIWISRTKCQFRFKPPLSN